MGIDGKCMVEKLALKDFDFELPRELIAAYPVEKRSEARLLVLDRKSGRLEHRIFKDVLEYFQKGDLLVLNNTKVFSARLYGRRPTGGRVEALLLKPVAENSWEMLVKPSGRIKKGTRLEFGENGVRLGGEVLDDPSKENGIRKIRFEIYQGRFSSNLNAGQEIERTVPEILAQIGRVPLPPYIDRPDEPLDRELYQTVFAEKEGAVASPTAGLHFDEELLAWLRQKGVEICFVTLHTSYGTFQPVEVEDFSKHEMYEEEYEISEAALQQIQSALKEKRRIVACGTTVVRTLETVAGPLTLPSPPLGERVGMRGETRIFIYPPYKFKGVDSLITNFHVPRSTLLMLVSAFAGRDFIFQAYEEAIRQKYRFYSYGDAMLIL